MKKVLQYISVSALLLICLLLSNFSAFSQKTVIWITTYAETTDSTATNKQPGLSYYGQNRAQALLKALKHEHIKAIYVTNKNAAGLTVAPLAQKEKLLPRVYTDSGKGLAAKILKNFEGSNVLIISRYNTIIPLVRALGGNPPFDGLVAEDHDLLFCVTIHNDKAELLISNYGKSSHVTEIPQQYILQNYYQGYAPPVTNH